MATWASKALATLVGNETMPLTQSGVDKRTSPQAIRNFPESKATNKASAATVDLATATGPFVSITGTTAITALGIVQAGAEFTLHFQGALTLTHNAVSLILPGAANIVTAAGDVAKFRSEGAGNWRCVGYMRANGLPLAVAIDIDGTLAANSDSKIPSQKAVKTYADALIAANDVMVLKGVIDCSANPNYPAANAGWTYRVSAAGKIGGAAGKVVAAGDILLCLVDGTAAGDQATVGANWAVIPLSGGGGTVDNSSVNAAIATNPTATRTALELGTAAVADETDFATAAQGALADTALQPAAVGDTIAQLVGGVVPTSQIPAIAITEKLADAANEAAMLALTGQKGDWTIRTDTGITWVITGDDPTLLANWTALSYPGAPVTTVNGQAGTVVLGAADVGADVSGAAAAAQAASEPVQTAASQAEAEAGTSTAVRSWTALRIWQAIAAKMTSGTWISGATDKATPVDADTLSMSDSAASGALKSLTWANLKATLKTYLDTLYAPAVLTKVSALASSAGVLNIDWSLGDYFTITLTENITSITHSNLPAAGYARTVMIRVQQHASAAKTVAMPAAFKWAGGTVGVVSTGVGAIDVLALTTFNQGTTFNATLAKAFA